MDGWVSINRKITDNWLWEDKPFSRGQAWIDLIILANHKENKFMLGSEIITVERGSFITSELKLMERWGWSKSKLRYFLFALESQQMIVKKTDHKKTTLTIVNYSDYQDIETSKKPKKDRKKTNDRPSIDTNNNDNNDNNILSKDNMYSSDEKLNSAILDFIDYRKKIKAPMTDKAISLLINTLNKLSSETDKQIEILNQSMVNGWKGVFELKTEKKQNKATKFTNFQQRDMDVDALEKELLSNGGNLI